jgi:hypothetical protein
MNEWIKWIFFVITIIIFIVAVIFITRAFRSQCSSGYRYDSNLKKCVPVCPPGEKYYPEIDSCSKCPLDQDYDPVHEICKDKCPSADFEYCGSQCYRPAQEKCYQDEQGNYNLCYNNQYYENKYLTFDPKESSYEATTRTLTLKMDSNEFSKIKEKDTLVINDDNTLTGIVEKILPNNNQIILKASSSGDSPFHTIASPNLTSCSVKGSFCCEDGTQYDPTTKTCIKCPFGTCEGKCLDTGYECINGRPCAATNIVVQEDDSKVCCDDPTRICGKQCCPVGQTCIPSGPNAGQCGVPCGNDFCLGSTQYCFKDQVNNQNLCLTSDCTWSSPLSYDPNSQNNQPTCKDTSGNVFFCNVVLGEGGNLTRNASNYACDPNVKDKCIPFTDPSKNKCSANDCQKRMNAFGVFEQDYAFDDKSLTCSAKFDCKKLPQCDEVERMSGGATAYTGLSDFALCRDINNKLTGQYCTNGSCINGNCGTFKCNLTNGNCEFKQGDFSGYPSLNACQVQGCQNLCAPCGKGTCTLSADQKSVTCSGCPTTDLPQVDQYNATINWVQRDAKKGSCEMCAPFGTMIDAFFDAKNPNKIDEKLCCNPKVYKTSDVDNSRRGYQCG